MIGFLHRTLFLLWARVNDPFGFLDPFTPCDFAGHDWHWDLSSKPRRRYCMRCDEGAK